MKFNKIAFITTWCLGALQGFSQITPQNLIDSMMSNHGKIKAIRLNEELFRIREKQVWSLPTTDFNLQQGQINASNWDYFFTISQSLDGIWQKKSLEKWVNAQGEMNALENQILVKELTLELKELVWLLQQSNQWKKMLVQQQSMLEKWKEQVFAQTQTGYSSEWELWVINQQLQRINQEINRFEQQIQYEKRSIEMYTQVKLFQEITYWNLWEESVKKELSPVFTGKSQVLEKELKQQLNVIQTQKFPSPYVGAFQQQLESIPGYVGVVTGLKVPFNYSYLQREKSAAKLEFQQNSEIVFQEIKSKQSELEINLVQISLERGNFSKALEIKNNDQLKISNWLNSNQKAGNKTFLEQSQLLNTFWENEKMILETQTHLGLLILQNQFLTQ